MAAQRGALGRETQVNVVGLSCTERGLGRETHINVVGLSWIDICHLKIRHSAMWPARAGLGDEKWGAVSHAKESKTWGTMYSGCASPSLWIGEDKVDVQQG